MTTAWLTVQQRLSGPGLSRIRAIATSAMIVVILGIGVVWNLPDAAISRALWPPLRSVAFAVGLDQNWSMYAPNPPQRQEDIEVHVVMADGSDKVWTLPRLNPVFGVAFSHRWRKFKEGLLTDPQLRPDFVHWVVREMAGPGDRPVRVDMLLQTEELLPPGVGGRGRTAVESLYSEELTGDR